MSALLALFRERGDRPALEDARSGLHLSYGELATCVEGARAFLSAHGVRAGDRVVQHLPSTPDALILMLACLCGGVDCAPLSMHATAAEARRWGELLQPRLVVGPTLGADPGSDALETLAPTTRIDLDGDLVWTRMDASAGSASDGGLITTTSGTSAGARALRLPLAALRACARAFVDTYPELQGEARYLCTAPVWSLSGLFNLCLLPLETGGVLLTGAQPSSVHPAKLRHDAARLKAEVLWLPPSVLRAVAADGAYAGTPAAALRCVLTGMGPITPEEKRRAAALFGAPVFENYGLAETLLLTASRDDADSGAPLAGVEVSLEGDEIRARSPFAADGYLLEKGVMESLARDPEGRVCTGDLGELSAGGRLVVHGRRKALIKRGEESVILPSVEAAAREAPGVADAVAVPLPSAPTEEGYALCLLADAAADPSALATAVRMRLAETLHRRAWPDRVIVIDDLPLLPNGKPDMQRMHALLAADAPAP